MTGSFFSTLFLSAMTSDENYVFTHTHTQAPKDNAKRPSFNMQ